MSTPNRVERLRRLVRLGRATSIAALGGAGLVAALSLTSVAASATGADVGSTGGSNGDGLTVSKTVTRTYYQPGSSDPTTDSDDVSVTVDKHTDLQSRERINVTWTGAHPTGGRVGNPYGENGLDQEYPMMIVECRGTDDDTLPVGQQVAPDTCWTNTQQERSTSDDASHAIWLDDRYDTDADKQQVSGIDQADLPADCPTIQSSTAYHFTPYVAADGTVYSACDTNHMPPEAAVGSVDPPNELFAYTGTDGTGKAQFEARTETENQSEGCSHTVPCTLEVIPIMGISCADHSAYCNKTGAYDPGSDNDGTTGAQDAVSGRYWWSPSNWRNRIAVPLNFALPASTCTLLGQGPPVPFYGSELLSQAALQWAPSYCLDKSRFNWQSNTMSDEAAFQQVVNNTADAAEVTGPQESDKGIGYAPTAATGFGIAFDIDDPQTGLPVTSLKLDARLVAKLLTESYPADAFGQKRPGIGTNPLSLQSDPEFLALNPGLEVAFGRASAQAAATLLTLSTSSGVMTQLTSYIAHDPDAMAFIHGQADPWGMKVNPAYKNIKLPVSTWPLLDGWTPHDTGNTCMDENATPYLQKIAAPVNNLRLIAQAMLFNWPLVQTACDLDPTTGIFKLGRVARQNIGQRFMLGTVTLGDAARYGLTVASLQAAPDHYVPADTSGINAGLDLMKAGQPGKPFTLDQAAVRKSTSAYPGTMVVYTAARTGPLVTKQNGKTIATVAGLDPTAAKDVSQFIQVSSSEGQVPGRGNGQLPGGYVPLTASGSTARFHTAATQVAAQVAAQKPIVTTLQPTATSTTPPTSPAPGTVPSDTPTDTTTTPGDGTTPAVPGTPGEIPPGTVPGDTSTPPGSSSTPSSQSTSASSVSLTSAAGPKTQSITSSLGGSLLLVLLLIGILAGGGAAAMQLVLRSRSVR